jgi:uncharacterized protein
VAEDYETEVSQWRVAREERLRSERGWLTLVGRYPLKPGENSFGSGKSNAIVLPDSLQLPGPDCLGSLVVDASGTSCTLKLNDGVSMFAGEGEAFTGERLFLHRSATRDWVWFEQLSMHVIQREGRFYVRIADSRAKTRTEFPGCTWYPAEEKYKVRARYVAYENLKLLRVKSIIDDESQEPSPGYAEFELDGQTYRLDAIQEPGGLFFVFRDTTAGDTTYSAARFIDIDHTPKSNATFTLDFNKAYNPPCAFSAYTVCPLPPKQNILDIRIEAGETYLINKQP